MKPSTINKVLTLELKNVTYLHLDDTENVIVRKKQTVLNEGKVIKRFRI